MHACRSHHAVPCIYPKSKRTMISWLASCTCGFASMCCQRCSQQYLWLSGCCSDSARPTRRLHACHGGRRLGGGFSCRKASCILGPQTSIGFFMCRDTPQKNWHVSKQRLAPQHTHCTLDERSGAAATQATQLPPPSVQAMRNS